ncbi:MAG: hypothetical protein NTZ48_02580, partial [Candidatus Omnitrophica bacterium]|nr:hypothetical protein [Candidatus Omnitrophota bacterium]
MKIFMKLAMLMIFMAAQISFAVLTDIKDESREIISLRRARQIENFDTIGSTWTKYDERAYSVYSSLTISNDPGESEKLKGQLIAILPFDANSSLR